jgi:nitroreductase
MDCITALQTRQSIRQYQAEEPDKDDLRQILDAGRMAPSADNLQPCHFIVVRDANIRKSLQEAAFGQEQTVLAPVVIVVCVEPERSAKYGDLGRNHFCLLDGANATENMLLAAHALGYGACYMGGFSEPAVKKALGLPEDFRVISLIPLGRPAEKPEPRPRRPLDDMVRWDRW